MRTKKQPKQRPQSANAAKARSISAQARLEVLLEAGYRCANPVCRHVLTLELHHIEWVKDGGGRDAANLLALCPNCHALHTQGHIPHAAIQVWKGLLVSLSNPHRGSADLLLVLHEEEKRLAALEWPACDASIFRFSGDSLPSLAGLLNSKLLVIHAVHDNHWFGVGPPPTFNVRLTDSGLALVEAWKSGDPVKLRAALTQRKPRAHPPESQTPNKAPEPTSGTVTPRAEPRVAPVPPVAHL